MGVLAHVVKRFLRHPQQRHLDLRVQRDRRAGRVIVRVQAARLLETGGRTLNGIGNDCCSSNSGR